MEDKRNLHLKVQELVDCFASNDPVKEMASLSGDADQDEAALKWLALTALHGVTTGAKKVSLKVHPDGQVTVRAKYRSTELPTPGSEIGTKIIEAVRSITHLEGDKAKGLLALGMRNDSLEVKVKLSRKDGGEQVTLKFPG